MDTRQPYHVEWTPLTPVSTDEDREPEPNALISGMSDDLNARPSMAAGDGVRIDVHRDTPLSPGRYDYRQRLCDCQIDIPANPLLRMPCTSLVRSQADAA